MTEHHLPKKWEKVGMLSWDGEHQTASPSMLEKKRRNTTASGAAKDFFFFSSLNSITKMLQSVLL